MDLGRLDEAAAAYEAAIELAEKRGDPRDVATGKGQLGTVRMLQRRYAEALAAWSEARQTFEQLGEPANVAGAWHQIGMVYQEAEQYESAESAYQESLKIKVRLGIRGDEAATLNQLGIVYEGLNRLEESVRFHQQAATIYAELGDLPGEGVTRSNLGIRLIKLRRYDEARRELLRAIECKQPYGHASEPWKTFAILCDLERAVGNSAAAATARQQALDAYLAYRHAGGESQLTGAAPQLVAMTYEAVQSGQTAEAAGQFDTLLQRRDLPGDYRSLLAGLKSILNGHRDPALAADPNLYYRVAAELQLLLERLAAPSPRGS